MAADWLINEMAVYYWQSNESVATLFNASHRRFYSRRQLTYLHCTLTQNYATLWVSLAGIFYSDGLGEFWRNFGLGDRKAAGPVVIAAKVSNGFTGK